MLRSLLRVILGNFGLALIPAVTAVLMITMLVLQGDIPINLLGYIAIAMLCSAQSAHMLTRLWITDK